MKTITHPKEGPQKTKGGYIDTCDSGPSAKTTARLKKALAVLLYTTAWSLAIYGIICWAST